MAFIKLDKAKYYQNLDTIALKAGGLDKVMLVLKDNAYGHGLKEISTLAFEYGVRKIAVKNMADYSLLSCDFEEVILLSHVVNKDEDKYKNISYALNCLEQIHLYPKGARVHLKIDTNMHRNGILPKDLFKALEIIKENDLELCGVFTHFASTVKQDEQMQVFSEIKNTLRKKFESLSFHSFNSAALFNKTLPKDELCRVGLAQFGYCEGLVPVLSLYAQLLSTRVLKKGECVGYDSKFCASSDMEIGCYDLGYGDGLFRFDGLREFCLPCKKPLLGVMSMDSFSIESKEKTLCVLEDARVMASFFNTIVYEILVKLSPNIKRIIV